MLIKDTWANKKIYSHPAHYILFVILSVFSLFAISMQTYIIDISTLTTTQNGYSKFARLLEAIEKTIGPIQPVYAIAAIVLLWLFYRNILKEEARISWTSLIVGGIFSFCLLIGTSFAEYGDFSFITYSKYQLVIALIFFIGYWGIFYVGICELIKKLDALQLEESSSGELTNWIDQHLYVVSAIIILISWIPYCVVFFPGNLTYDAQAQLNQFYGVSELTNHHPVVSTLIMGIIVRVGDFIAGKAFGLALYMIFQSLICALVFADICVYLRKKGMPIQFIFGCIIFYAIVPSWGAYAATIVKDTLYYAVFAWFVLEYIKYILGDSGKYGFYRLLISAMLICLLRNEGVYIAAIAMIVLLFIVGDKRIGACILLVAVLISGIGINHYMFDSLGIASDRDKESMSIPFLQVARYVRDCGETLSEDDIEIIDAILDYDHIVDNYDPELADNVKVTYKKDATQEEINEFWKLWAREFVEQPVVYTEAAVNQIYGYFDPFYFRNDSLGLCLYMAGESTSEDEEPSYADYTFSEEIRDMMKQYTRIWKNTPILSFLVNGGTYTWIGILLLALLLRKRKWRNAMVYVIPIMNILICCASPINGSLRYMLPVMACMPLYIYWGLRPYLFKMQSMDNLHRKD